MGLFMAYSLTYGLQWTCSTLFMAYKSAHGLQWTCLRHSDVLMPLERSRHPVDLAMAMDLPMPLETSRASSGVGHGYGFTNARRQSPWPTVDMPQMRVGSLDLSFNHPLSAAEIVVQTRANLARMSHDTCAAP